MAHGISTVLTLQRRRTIIIFDRIYNHITGCIKLIHITLLTCCIFIICGCLQIVLFDQTNYFAEYYTHKQILLYIQMFPIKNVYLNFDFFRQKLIEKITFY